MGSKSQAKMKARERVLAKEAAQRMTQVQETNDMVLDIYMIMISVLWSVFCLLFDRSEIDNLVSYVEVLVHLFR